MTPRFRPLSLGFSAASAWLLPLLGLANSLGAVNAGTDPINTQTEYYAAAKAGLPTLAAPVGVRAIGMGEAYTAAGDDLSSLHWNPAGLARMNGFQLGLMHNELSSTLGVRQEYLGYGMGLGPDSGLALAINYFSLGTLTKRSDTGAAGQESGAMAINGAIGYGFGLMDNGALRTGLMAEFGSESFLGAGTSGFGAGLGLQYDISRTAVFGVALRHLGSAGGGFSTPASVDGGLSMGFGGKTLLLALDGSMPFNGTPLVKAGLELGFGGAAVRGGWRQAMGAPEGDTGSGFTAGAGYKAGVFALDYAFVPYGSISTAHRVSMSLDLPADFFKPKIIDAGASTTSSKSYYDRALAFERQGKLLDALVQYQRSTEAYPRSLVEQKKTQIFYQTGLKKIALIQKEMSKSGQSDEVRGMIAKALNDGRAALGQRRFRDAIRSAKEVLALDKENPDAQGLLDQAFNGRKLRIRELLSQGTADYDAGRLVSAVSRYREVLKLDPADADASAFFVNHRPEIMELLKKLHRKGIDFYVSGKIKEAVGQWKEGLAIDPEDPINFRRDIEKAEKVLEVRGGK